MPLKSGASSSKRSTERSRRKRGETLERDPYESPSRQMIIEFSQMLIRSDRDFNEKLDQSAAESARIHNDQLSKAALEHVRIREGAEREKQRLELEEERARIRREAEEKAALERIQRENARLAAEEEQRRLEAKRREEDAARQAAERRRQLQEAEARERSRKEQVEREQKENRDRAEADRKAKEAAATAAAAERARAQAAPVPHAPSIPIPQAAPPRTSTTTVTTSSPADVEALHKKYLELHARMKIFRNEFKEAARQTNSPLKKIVGDTRRAITMRMGQITPKRTESAETISKLRETLSGAKAHSGGPTIDIRPFIVSYPIPPVSEGQAQYPAILLYAIICFIKALSKGFQLAASGEGEIIEQMGLIAASLLADKKYQWNGLPLSDLLLAKYHHACPILFGISGNLETRQGRDRLGLILRGSKGNKQEQQPNEYTERMLGMSCGFAAMSLRNFQSAPAIPMSEYWRAVSSICNMPAASLYGGHYTVLKGLLRDYAVKFIYFYGMQARAVLRRALIDLPLRAPPHAADVARILAVLPDELKSKRGIDLLQ
ncbi:hypothetical protein BDV96DRAFT_609960 [Lophiotrema nucula]|uniref:mRNA export factor GLE1 n=1 Tax=Lophiotrema nucula TaxID=690887 RepID=A0A6A5ZNV2_9PLEO|nr:hypothetical protein BDV96DRAFT_609960 [Lophiotrema nucula]